MSTIRTKIPAAKILGFLGAMFVIMLAKVFNLRYTRVNNHRVDAREASNGVFI